VNVRYKDAELASEVLLSGLLLFVGGFGEDDGKGVRGVVKDMVVVYCQQIYY
jgi:hypothetical protein